MLFLQTEDKKLDMMKESSDFIEFLRIYSCIMKMSFEEILSNYTFKYENVKSVFTKLFMNLKNGLVKDESFDTFVSKQIGSSSEFNSKVNKLMEFYGSSMSDVLDTKLSFLKNDLDKYINEYEHEYKERKKLLNKLSFLIGSLIAIVLI
jgi:hypothetical protein